MHKSWSVLVEIAPLLEFMKQKGVWRIEARNCGRAKVFPNAFPLNFKLRSADDINSLKMLMFPRSPTLSQPQTRNDHHRELLVLQQWQSFQKFDAVLTGPGL